MADLPVPLARLERFSQERVAAERRRRLAEAWHAGYRNVRQLRDVSGISRTTLYADLKAMGIDPRNRSTPVLPARPLPETAESSLLGELHLAALAALPHTHGDRDGEDPNPHTRELSTYDLARAFAITARGEEGLGHESLEDLKRTVHYAERPVAAARARWIAWELRRLGAEADAIAFERIAERDPATIYYAYASGPLYDLMIYRAGDEKAWDARGFRNFVADAEAWHWGYGEPTEGWAKAPEPAELDPAPAVRRAANAAWGDSERTFGHYLVAQWTQDEGLTYPDGADEIHPRLRPSARRYLELDPPSGLPADSLDPAAFDLRRLPGGTAS